MRNKTFFWFILPPITDDEKLSYRTKVSLYDDTKLPPYFNYTEGNFTVDNPLKSGIFIIKACLDDGYSK